MTEWDKLGKAWTTQIQGSPGSRKPALGTGGHYPTYSAARALQPGGWGPMFAWSVRLLPPGPQQRLDCGTWGEGESVVQAAPCVTRPRVRRTPGMAVSSVSDPQAPSLSPPSWQRVQQRAVGRSAGRTAWPQWGITRLAGGSPGISAVPAWTERGLGGDRLMHSGWGALGSQAGCRQAGHTDALLSDN